MSPEQKPAKPIPGRRSHGEAAHLQRAAEAARRAGKPFTRPGLPEYLSPMDRLDYDRFIFPALQKLPDETVSIVNKNPAIVKDFWEMLIRIFGGADARVERTEFREAHPTDGKANMHIMQELTPAFDFIEGRFRQAENALLSGYASLYKQRQSYRR